MPEESEEAPPKWMAVGNSVKNRRAERGMSRNKLAKLSRIPVSTIQEIENHTKVRKRCKGTLEDISAVLWPEEKKTYLDEVLAGDRPEYTAPEPRDRLPINSLRDVLERIDERLRNIENRLARPDTIRLPDGTVVTVEVAKHDDEPDTPQTP